jgi:uncharacterized protein YdaU (DUF1376 family)
MAKDPAFLFYSADFMVGTSVLSHEQVGKYVRLLCMQHQKGHLKQEHMINICGGCDEDVFSKFVQDGDGLFFNARLEEEIKKRKAYSKSRSDNRKSKKQSKIEDSNIISSTYDATQEHHMVNEDENINDNRELEDRGVGEGENLEWLENVTDNSPMGLEQCFQAFLLSQAGSSGREVLYRRKPHMFSSPNTVKQELAEWAYIFNDTLKQKQIKQKKFGEWSSHFINWISKEDTSQDPNKYFENAHNSRKNGSHNSGGRFEQNISTPHGNGVYGE